MYYWLVENSDGEAIDTIYQHDPNLPDEWYDWAAEQGWSIQSFVEPQPAWEFAQYVKHLNEIAREGL
jgi:hypothetical protein